MKNKITALQEDAAKLYPYIKASSLEESFNTLQPNRTLEVSIDRSRKEHYYPQSSGQEPLTIEGSAKPAESNYPRSSGDKYPTIDASRGVSESKQPFNILHPDHYREITEVPPSIRVRRIVCSICGASPADGADLIHPRDKDGVASSAFMCRSHEPPAVVSDNGSTTSAKAIIAVRNEIIEQPGKTSYQRELHDKHLGEACTAGSQRG